MKEARGVIKKRPEYLETQLVTWKRDMEYWQERTRASEKKMVEVSLQKKELEQALSILDAVTNVAYPTVEE